MGHYLSELPDYMQDHYRGGSATSKRRLKKPKLKRKGQLWVATDGVDSAESGSAKDALWALQYKVLMQMPRNRS